MQEVYGLDSDVIETVNIGGLAPGAAIEAESRMILPASLFTYCGYDALLLEVLDGNENVLAATDEVLVVMEQPMNVTVNNGVPVTLWAGDTAEVKTRCNATPFMRRSLSVVYSVADPSIAAVDAQGNLMGLSEGVTTLTATLLPSGRTAEVPVTVYEFYGEEAEEAAMPPESAAITVQVSGDEGSVSVTASVSNGTAAVTAPTEEQLEAIVGKSRETGSVTIDLNSLPETVSAVSIPAETVKAIDEALEEDGEGLTLRLPGSSVTFDAEALSSIAEEIDGEDPILHVEPIDESVLSDAQCEALAGLDVQAIYDVYLSSNNQRITDLGGGRATVEVENRLGSNQKPGVVVWYLAENGAKKKQPTSAAAEAVRFIVTHFLRCHL